MFSLFEKIEIILEKPLYSPETKYSKKLAYGLISNIFHPNRRLIGFFIFRRTNILCKFSRSCLDFYRKRNWQNRIIEYGATEAHDACSSVVII